MRIKYTLFFFSFFFSVLFLQAQQGSISGRVMEDAKKPLGFATVAIYKAVDTSLITYRLSAPQGEFKVPALPLNVRMRLLITFTGFETFRKEFELSAAHTSQRFDTILLRQTTKELEELVIVAELPPVVIKKDTIEFNASAFKTLPNAMVEDLLKKLPGVEVDRDGTISVEGKNVNRITVDGKSFFGDDPKMATRNLPANVIDKVQVTDDKEEMIRRGDDNPNNVGKVINLTFKKDVKKGWFGKIYAGGGTRQSGTKELYQGGGIANIYRDTLQLSILAYANNLNKAPFSFSELLSAGGFQRSRSNSANIRNNVWNYQALGTGISIDNVNFGGAQSIGGISKSKGAGFNMNHAPNKKRSFYLQYFHNEVDINEREIRHNVDQFKGDTVVTSNSKETGPYHSFRHNVAAGLRLKPDSLTNILFNSSLVAAGSEDQLSNTLTTTNNKIGTLSSGNINNFTNSRIQIYRQNAIFTHLSRTKKGRRYTLSHDLEYRPFKNNNFNNSINHFVYPSILDTNIQQLRRESVPYTELNVSFNYSEPITKKLTLRFAARYDFLKFNNAVETYNYDANTKSYDLFNNLLTNNLHRKNNQITSTVGMEYRWKDLTLTPGVKFQWQKIINDISKTPVPVEQKQFNVLPSFSATYKTWNLFYSRNVELPAYNYLVPVADNTNPYYITKGNPDLLPSIYDQVNLNYRKNNLKKLFTYGFNTGFGFIKNFIVPFITVDNSGVFTNYPVNVNGTRNMYLNYFLNKQYKHSAEFMLSLNHSFGLGINKSRLLYNYESAWQNNLSIGGRLGFNMNVNDKFEWTSNYYFNRNYIRYTSSAFKNMEVYSHSLENELILRYPKHFIWETNVQYYINPYAASGFSAHPLIWNAGINYTMLKKERGVLKLEVSDLLDSYKFVTVFTSRNTIQTNSNNVLGRYFLLSFTYNIQTIGEKKKIGGWRLSLF